MIVGISVRSLKLHFEGIILLRADYRERTGGERGRKGEATFHAAELL